MPNINISDDRGRDAVVKAESVRARADVRYIGPRGQAAYSRRLLKATVDQSYETLIEKHKDDEGLVAAMAKGDPELDLEQVGQFLWGMSRVYVNPKEELVYRVTQTEIVRNVDGSLREKRPRRALDANVDGDIPLTWTGTTIPKAEAVRRFIFRTKLQIVHVNGLTFDFLFDMAKELHEAGEMMVMGAGKTGRSPLVFRRGSTPYRAFLEGRIEGEAYVLLLHLSNLEMKTLKDVTGADEADEALPSAKKTTKTPTGKTAKAKAAKPKAAKSKASAKKKPAASKSKKGKSA